MSTYTWYFENCYEGWKRVYRSKSYLPTSAATAVWRLTYKSNLRRQSSSSFSRSNSLPDSPVTHAGCVCAASHLVFSLPLFFEDALKGCADVEKLRIIEDVFSAQANHQQRTRCSTERASKTTAWYSASVLGFFFSPLKTIDYLVN